MAETTQERKDRERQEDLAKLRGLRPIDDDFMRCIFRDNYTVGTTGSPNRHRHGGPDGY